ncbi:MAG: hypothetical protein E6Q97_31410 [Desulfurellales bacterium]|nr:MAG: hypothetical protein E6Q97_31410 [Desulfurellales bacterium]
MKWSTDIPPIVKPYRDALGWLLVYTRCVDGFREGDPHGDPDSPSGRYKNRAAAKRKADDINAAHRELLSRATRS